MGSMADPWASSGKMGGIPVIPTSAGISAGAIGSRSWMCDQCGAENVLGATRCVVCHWDRKAATKNRIRQELLAKMAGNGGIPGGFPSSLPPAV